MDAFVDWITQIIIFMLLATIIELLIPATSMKKYIKLVIALILILVFLKPIFYLFQIDVKQALNDSYERLEATISNKTDMKKSIEFQKSEIQEQQRAYIEKQMAVPLIDLAKTPLLESYQVAITDMELLFASEKAPTFDDLEEVIVYIDHAEESEEGVTIVDEVVINTDKTHRNKDSPKLEKVEELLRDIWEVENKEITVVWKGGTS